MSDDPQDPQAPVEAPDDAPDVHPDQEPLPTPDTGDYPAPGGPPEHDDTAGAPRAERRYGER